MHPCSNGNVTLEWAVVTGEQELCRALCSWGCFVKGFPRVKLDVFIYSPLLGFGV